MQRQLHTLIARLLNVFEKSSFHCHFKPEIHSVQTCPRFFDTFKQAYMFISSVLAVPSLSICYRPVNRSVRFTFLQRIVSLILSHYPRYKHDFLGPELQSRRHDRTKMCREFLAHPDCTFNSSRGEKITVEIVARAISRGDN